MYPVGSRESELTEDMSIGQDMCECEIGDDFHVLFCDMLYLDDLSSYCETWYDDRLSSVGMGIS